MKPKSNSAIKKRIRVTGTGKIKFRKSCRNHLLTQKSKRQKRACNHPLDVSKCFAKRVRQTLHS